MKKIIVLLSLLVLIAGCNDVEEKEGKEETQTIYATIYPIEYALERLIGEEINIETIIDAGGDAHTFEPTQQQINQIAESEMFFYLGLGLEESASKLTNALASTDVEIVEVGESLSIEEEHNHEEENAETEESHDHDHEEEVEESHEDHEHSENHSNHHIWVDPIYMIDIVSVVKEDLIAHYPEHTELINTNYEALVIELEELDEEYESVLSETSKDVFVVSHDAFAHLEKYDITSLPVKDEAHAKDPTQQEINEIIETAQDNNLEYVFYDQNIPCLPLDVIKTEIAAEKMTLHNLSVRTETDISEGSDYFDLMYENLDNLVIALN